MDAVVEHIAGDDEVKVGHVQNAGLIGVTVADLDDDALVSRGRSGCLLGSHP